MKKIMLKLAAGLTALFILGSTFPAHAKEYEKYYQEQWCMAHNGEAEVVLEDMSRVDCITATEAVEVDFAHKWAEAIGQSLLYANMLDKEPAVLLIVNEKSAKYITRFHNAADGLGIKIYLIEE